MEMVCTNIHALFGVLSSIHIVLDLLLLIIIILSLATTCVTVRVQILGSASWHVVIAVPMAPKCSCDVCTALPSKERKRADSAGWLNVKCLLRMDPLFTSYPQEIEKKDSLQQNSTADVDPKTKRREAAEYRAAHKPEAAE